MRRNKRRCLPRNSRDQLHRRPFLIRPCRRSQIWCDTSTEQRLELGRFAERHELGDRDDSAFAHDGPRVREEGSEDLKDVEVLGVRG